MFLRINPRVNVLFITYVHSYVRKKKVEGQKHR
jgi:hypothetical protein